VTVHDTPAEHFHRAMTEPRFAPWHPWAPVDANIAVAKAIPGARQYLNEARQRWNAYKSANDWLKPGATWAQLNKAVAEVLKAWCDQSLVTNSLKRLAVIIVLQHDGWPASQWLTTLDQTEAWYYWLVSREASARAVRNWRVQAFKTGCGHRCIGLDVVAVAGAPGLYVYHRQFIKEGYVQGVGASSNNRVGVVRLMDGSTMSPAHWYHMTPLRKVCPHTPKPWYQPQWDGPTIENDDLIRRINKAAAARTP